MTNEHGKDIAAVVGGKPVAIPEAILSRIDGALSLKQRDLLARTVEEIISDLAGLPAGEDQAEVDYLVGYLWYIHPSRLVSSSIVDLVEKSLSSAIQSSPDHALAWMYLGHNAYDFGRYKEAHERFTRVDPRSLSLYLGLKSVEMLASCSIRLKGVSDSRAELVRYVEAAEESEKEDVWPSELARALEDASTTQTLLEIEDLAERIDSVGRFGSWFRDIVHRRRPA